MSSVPRASRPRPPAPSPNAGGSAGPAAATPGCRPAGPPRRAAPRPPRTAPPSRAAQILARRKTITRSGPPWSESGPGPSPGGLNPGRYRRRCGWHRCQVAGDAGAHPMTCVGHAKDVTRVVHVGVAYDQAIYLFPEAQRGAHRRKARGTGAAIEHDDRAVGEAGGGGAAVPHVPDENIQAFAQMHGGAAGRAHLTCRYELRVDLGSAAFQLGPEWRAARGAAAATSLASLLPQASSLASCPTRPPSRPPAGAAMAGYGARGGGAALRPVVGRLGGDGAARGGKQLPPAPRPRRAGRLARTGRSARRVCGKNCQKRRDPCRRKAAGRSPRRPRPCVQSAISGAARRGGHAQGASAPSAASPSRRASTLGAAFS